MKSMLPLLVGLLLSVNGVFSVCFPGSGNNNADLQQIYVFDDEVFEGETMTFVVNFQIDVCTAIHERIFAFETFELTDRGGELYEDSAVAGINFIPTAGRITFEMGEFEKRITVKSNKVRGTDKNLKLGFKIELADIEEHEDVYFWLGRDGDQPWNLVAQGVIKKTPPTDPPTLKPSRAPTGSPSKRPTHQPTISPTHSPTHQPTISPSSHPSVTPTAAPTITSCLGLCQSHDLQNGHCYCDQECKIHDDCCGDYDAICASSCQGNCGHQAFTQCYCDSKCMDYTDCCKDYHHECATCSNSCGNYNTGAFCQCDDECDEYGDCCKDYKEFCVVRD